MYIRFTSRTNYRKQGSAAAQNYDVSQVDDFSEADAANLIAMGVAREATRQEATAAKAAAERSEVYVPEPPGPPSWNSSARP